MNLIELFNRIESNIINGNTLKDCSSIIKDYNETDYIKYIQKDTNKYYRNIVMKNENIELVVITWSKGQSSGFHGHPGECIFKVLENEITEELLTINTNTINTTDTTNTPDTINNTNTINTPDTTNVYNRGDIGYIDNSIGTHRMVSPEDSVTLHIYYPPF
jgi:hypothetical protein